MLFNIKRILTSEGKYIIVSKNNPTFMEEFISSLKP